MRTFDKVTLGVAMVLAIDTFPASAPAATERHILPVQQIDAALLPYSEIEREFEQEERLIMALRYSKCSIVQVEDAVSLDGDRPAADITIALVEKQEATDAIKRRHPIVISDVMRHGSFGQSFIGGTLLPSIDLFKRTEFDVQTFTELTDDNQKHLNVEEPANSPDGHIIDIYVRTAADSTDGLWSDFYTRRTVAMTACGRIQKVDTGNGQHWRAVTDYPVPPPYTQNKITHENN